MISLVTPRIVASAGSRANQTKVLIVIDRPDRAIVVIPHPDDAEIGCGGTVARWIKEGAEVVYVLCTNGDKGSDDPDMTSERLASIREVEQSHAAQVLGVAEVVFLRHPDGGLEDTSLLRGQLVKAIRTFRPSTILCPDPYRRGSYLHRDHRVCGQVTLDAAFPYARDRLHFPEHIKVDGLEPHKVGDALLWSTEDPDTFVDISETIELKIQSLNEHVSQVSGPDTNVDEFVKDNALRIGQRSDYPYAEAFRRIAFRG